MAAASVLALIPVLEAAAQDGAATEVWTLDGFSTPESVAFDPERDELYVSNVVGDAAAKDGVGHISRVSRDGAMLEAEWVTGLDAPKGLALDGDTLYVTDIDRLVAIDVETGTISGTWPGEGAQFLNDPAVAEDGRVFVSDMVRNAIYVLDGDAFTLWLEDAGLHHPNGLKLDAGRLVVAPWGQDMQPDMTTRVGGYLLTVDLETQAIAPLGSDEPVGNLDGLEPDGAGNWLATDWVAGGLFRIGAESGAERLHPLATGSADLGFIAEDGLAVVPMMMDGRITAYRVE